MPVPFNDTEHYLPDSTISVQLGSSVARVNRASFQNGHTNGADYSAGYNRRCIAVSASKDLNIFSNCNDKGTPSPRVSSLVSDSVRGGAIAREFEIQINTERGIVNTAKVYIPRTLPYTCLTSRIRIYTHGLALTKTPLPSTLHAYDSVVDVYLSYGWLEKLETRRGGRGSRCRCTNS